MLRLVRSSEKNIEEDVCPEILSAGNSCTGQVRRNDSSSTSTLSTRSSTVCSLSSRSSVVFSDQVIEAYFDRNDPPNMLYRAQSGRSASVLTPIVKTASFGTVSPPTRRVERRHRLSASLY